MIYDRDRWLARLPLADETTTSDLTLEGWPVSAGCGNDTRIVVGLLCLAFSATDVVAVHELEGGRVRLIVRRGAPLLDAVPWECVAGEIPRGRKPFALSSRPLTIRSLPFSRFRELEARYLGGTAVATGLSDDPARHTKG